LRVLIDDQPLDVTLETEETLSQVIMGVSSYLMGHGLIITGLDVDDNALELDQLAVWGDREIEGIREIHLRTQAHWELSLNHLHLVHQFLEDWHSALSAKDDDRVRALATNQSDLAGHLEEHIALIFNDLPSSAFESLFSVAGNPELMARPEGGPDALMKELDILIPLIEQRLAEMNQPARVAAATATLVTGMLPGLQEISVMLQTGRDQEAMAILFRFTESLEKLLRTLPHLARVDQSFNSVYHRDSTLVAAGADLNERLHELVEAFDSEDTVLIGDLLEYEIVPRIEQLLAVIPTGSGE
jgi:hypothetical protein